jgi:5'-nucleotidase
MKRLKILLTNDDGINARGIRTLWEGLKDVADLALVAPSSEQSGKGVSVTFYGPIRVEKRSTHDNTPAFAVFGTPADSVKLALGGLLNWTPDLIVSGINHGSNAGRGILYSGTVGSVIQGTLQGIPGIAFSYTCPDTEEFPHVKPYLFPLIEYVMEYSLPSGTFLNVNFPSQPIQGIKMARQGLEFWYEAPRKVEHPAGYFEFHLEASRLSHDEHPESDIALLEGGFVTAVPIHISELTDQTHFEEQRSCFDIFIEKKRPTL